MIVYVTNYNYVCVCVINLSARFEDQTGRFKKLYILYAMIWTLICLIYSNI